MITTTTLGLQDAKNIAAAAEAAAIKYNCMVSIAVVNEPGHLLYFIRMDGSTNASADIAIAKARHAVYYNRDTAFHENLLTQGNNLVLSLPNSMPIEGGVRILFENKTIGAIGVSGASSKDDGIIAMAGAATGSEQVT